MFGLISNILMSMLDFIDNFLDLNVFPWTFSFLYLLRIVPIFSMLFGYQKLYKLSTFSRICHQVPFLEFECAALKSHEDYTLAGLVLRGCCPELCGDKCFSTGSPWTMGMYGSGTEVIYLIVSGLFYLTVIIMFECKLMCFMMCSQFPCSLMTGFRLQATYTSVVLNCSTIEMVETQKVKETQGYQRTLNSDS